MNLRRLFKRFLIGGVLLILGSSLVLWGAVMMLWGRDAYFSPIPRLESYEAQKDLAHQVQDKAASASEIFAPRLYWNWPLRAYQTLLDRYPERASQDENVWAGMGDCYMFLKRFNKAIECYQRRLDLFKTQYYEKDYPQKREVGVLKTELEEIRWIANIHGQIANAYLGMKQPHQAIAEYEKVIKEFGPKLQKHDSWEQYKIVGGAYEQIAFIYANWIRDYQKAMAVYEAIIQYFPEKHNAISDAKTAIADCYVAIGNLEKAKALYRTIIEEYPDPKTGYAWTAKQHLKQVESGDLARWRVGS